MAGHDGFEMRWKNHVVAEEFCTCATWRYMKSSLEWVWAHNVMIIAQMCMKNVWSMGVVIPGDLQKLHGITVV